MNGNILVGIGGRSVQSVTVVLEWPMDEEPNE
jgi:hypothetical protein